MAALELFLDYRVVDMKIDEIFDAPAHGGAQLVGRYIRRLDGHQAITRGSSMLTVADADSAGGSTRAST